VSTLPGNLLTMSATVETYLGVNGKGEARFSDPLPFKCFAEAGRRLVRSAQTGQEVLGSTTLYAQRTAAGGPLFFPPRSVVTLNGLQRVEVVECRDRDGAGLPTPDHLEIICA
jgi:hypothetical protein